MAAEGYEFNILEVGRDIPAEWLTNRQEVKRLLLSNGIVFVATGDAAGNICWEPHEFATACQLVVLAAGEK